MHMCRCVCVNANADRQVNSVCLRADGSQGADLFLRLEAEFLMSPLREETQEEGRKRNG